jgi:hypothetical protein
VRKSFGSIVRRRRSEQRGSKRCVASPKRSRANLKGTHSALQAGSVRFAIKRPPCSGCCSLAERREEFITTSPLFGHDLSRISIHPAGRAAIPTKLEIKNPGDDIHEQEADRVSEQLIRVPEPQLCGGGAPNARTSGLAGNMRTCRRSGQNQRHRPDCSNAHRSRSVALIRRASRPGDSRIYGTAFWTRLQAGARPR